MTTQSAQNDQGMRAAAGSQPPWLIVAIREMVVKLTDRSFIISTVVTLVLLGVGIAFMTIMGSRTNQMKVAVTSSDAAELASQIDAAQQASSSKDSITVVREKNDADARAAVLGGKANVYLMRNDGAWTAVYKDSVSGTFQQTASQVVAAAAMSQLATKAGVSMSEVTAASTVNTELLKGDQSRSMVGYFVGIGFGVLFLMSMMTFGPQIANSVCQEKQSRVVEILVASIPVTKLLTGKVVGNTIMALLQTALFAVVGLVGLGSSSFKDLLPVLNSAAIGYLLLFLAGFLAMACLWAAGGSLASRVEDVANTTQPLMWIVMIAYVAGFVATGTWQFVLSYVPVLSTVLMPVRLALGTAQWLDVAIALVLDVIFAAGAVVLGARIYRNGLLQTRGKLSVRQALAMG